MKSLLALAFAALVLALELLPSQDPPKDEPPKPAPPAGEAEKQKKEGEKEGLPTLRDKASYGIGVSIARNLKGQFSDIDLKLVYKGLEDSMTGGKPLLSEQEALESIRAYHAETQKILGEKNKKDGEAFLADNKAKEGVMTLPSGLQYKVITAGTGPKPTATSKVTTHYRGTLIDGTEFDSSYARNEPASFGVGGVIKGWTEALQLMPMGSKWMLYIPSELAYGVRGSPPKIGPNATLIFEIELLGIE